MWRWFSGTAPRLNTNKVPGEQTGPGVEWRRASPGEGGCGRRTNLGWFQPNLEQKTTKLDGTYRGRRRWGCLCSFLCICLCLCLRLWRWRWRWVAGNHLPRPASNYLFLCCLSAGSWGQAVWSCSHRLLVQAMRHPLKHKSKREAWPSMRASELDCFSNMRTLLAARSHAHTASSSHDLQSSKRHTHTHTHSPYKAQLSSHSTRSRRLHTARLCSGCGSAQTWIERGALKYASCALGWTGWTFRN